MEFIKVRNSDEMVRIEIRISFVGPQKYVYVIPPGISLSYRYPGDPLRPFPHKYNIGQGKDLTVNGNNSNNWSFELKNPSSQDLDYEISIEWYQGNGEPIDVWTRKGTIKANADPTSFDDSCIYELKTGKLMNLATRFRRGRRRARL